MDLRTFALETYAERALNYLDRMVDADGLPYFNVFWEEPAQAAHDWPDFGDVMTRGLQGAIMARRMTGRTCVNEARWMRKAMGYISPETGLLTRQATSYCAPGADPGDYALTLYALVTAYQDAPDPNLAAVICRMVAGFPLVRNDSPGTMAFAIKSLMAAARTLGLSEAAEHAAECVRIALGASPILLDDNTYPTGGHMHIFTRGLVGMADYALYVGDPVLFSRVNSAYLYLRSLDPGFGFLPEVVDRPGDVIACETCALMDYIGLGVTLANNGHPEHWAGIERLVRNHLVESQSADPTWLRSDDTRPDTEQFTWRQIGERMLGGWAGWSSPTQFVACREELHWGGAELRGKVRAFQNCCGGSGVHALYIAWKHAAQFERGMLRVNLHCDKLMPEAEIRCQQPWRGELTIALRADCDVHVRVPDFAGATDIEAEADGKPVACSVSGAYLRVPDRQAGERLTVRYPVPMRTERVAIGNRWQGGEIGLHYPLMSGPGPGKRGAPHRYRYSVTWRGDTVVAITPIGRIPRRGYSDFEQRRIDIFYGDEGPCRLYRRDHMRSDAPPEPATIHCDTSPVDHWLGTRSDARRAAAGRADP